MTPPAATSAGRAGAAARRTAAAPSSSQVPRPARAPLTRVPRRVSGPVKRARKRSAVPETWAVRLLHGTVSFTRSLPDHRLIDRLVRGRAWIPVLGVLLAGIVATQVEVLKLGASMGRWMERSAALTSRNQSLQASVAALSDDQRIERLAARMGMVVPAPTAITFLSSHTRGGVRAAVGKVHSPDTAQFAASLSTVVTAPTIPALTTGTSSSTSSTSSGGTTTAAPGG
ncbi:MAG: hypothetical protein ACJ764_00710 [Solirubrobacteraceae bacterium]